MGFRYTGNHEQGVSYDYLGIGSSNALPIQEKTVERVAVEAHMIKGAGFETTGNILTHLTYNVLADKMVHERLMKVFGEVIPDSDFMPNCTQLEKLPYLTAMIKETLRYAVCLQDVRYT
ncbi:hypothetical protein Vi05172_g12939 [Venturia inaequalis]|nr:hypothetical protein Vi05172_g12939 [Venturia inaequalis]